MTILAMIWDVAGAVCKMVLQLLKVIVTGITNIVGNPATLVAVATLLVAAFAFGIRTGVILDGKLAATAIEQGKRKLVEVQRKLDEATSKKVADAGEAERSVAPTPIEKAEREIVCKNDAACRDRKGIK